MPNLAATIAVGSSPLRVTYDTNYIYVLNAGANTVSTINPGDNTVVSTFNAATGSVDLAVDGAKMWIVDGSGSLRSYFYNGSSSGLRTGGWQAPIFYDGTFVWTAFATGNQIYRITLTAPGIGTNTPLSLGTPPVGTSYQAVGFAFDGTNLWVSVNNVGGTAHKVLKVDPATPAVLATYSAAAWSAYYHGIDYDTTNGFLWVNGNDGNIRKINPATGAVVATVATTSSANVCFEPLTPSLWNDHQSPSIYSLDLTAGSQLSTIGGLGNLTRVWCYAFSSIWASSSYFNVNEVYRISGLAPLGPAPTVTLIAASSGGTSGGTPVTITGTNFVSGASVAIGGITAASISFVSATSLTCVTPANLVAGTYDVVVTNPDGQQATLHPGYTYTYETPAPLSVAPSSGLISGGTNVTITGTGFSSASTVLIGGNPATSVTVNSSSSLTCVTPAGAAGAANVAVSNPGPLTGTLVAGFSYITLPPPPPASSRWNAGNAVVGIVHARESTYVVLSNADGSLTKTFLYDMDRKVWLKTSMGIVAMTEDLYNGSLAFFYGRADGTIIQGFTATSPNYGPTPQIQTVYMTPPGKGRQDWAIFQGVHVYGSQFGLSVSVSCDDGAPIALSIAVDATNTLMQGVDDVLYVPQGQAPRGRLFRITISWPDASGEALSSFEGVWTVDVDPASVGGVV
jgi:hypothetical protein